MAIPVLPLLLLGVGVLALRSRRRSPKKTTSTSEDEPQPIQTVIYVPPPTAGDAPPGPSGLPGQPCVANDGPAAWDHDGDCRTFWIDGQTDDAIARLAREEWEAHGRPTFSELCLTVDDPLGGELAPPKDNPRFVEIVVAALDRYYDAGPVFPPTVPDGPIGDASPYWVTKAWAKANAVVRRELCGG